MRHLVAPTPPAPGIPDPGTARFITGGYCPRLSIQLMKEQMDTRSQELPFLTQPPQYASTYGMDDLHSPCTKSHLGYLKELSLVPSFKPQIVYLMMETIPGGPQITPQPLGIFNPTDPSFSDLLWEREMRAPGPGCPFPPHMLNVS